VIILTVMPAAWQVLTAAIAFGRGGSTIPTRPTNSRPPSALLAFSEPADAAARRATASTRKPDAAIVAAALSISSRRSDMLRPLRSSMLRERDSNCSSAPLK